MNIVIKTAVKGDPASVISRFDRELFEALTPPGPGVELIRFDGSRTGDIVHIRLDFFTLFSEDWISEIVEDGQTEEAVYFIDQGKELPFFLRSWKHKHIVQSTETYSIIIDDITFKTPFFLFDLLLYPVLYFQFAYRKPIYQKFFGKP